MLICSHVICMYLHLPHGHQLMTFMRRLLGLEPEVQECIFDFYQAILEATIAQARREGRYDEGIVDVSGTSITLAEEPQVCLTVIAK